MDVAGRFLVTGAGGFIGRNVVGILLQRGAHVRALLGPMDEELTGPRALLDQHRADIRDRAALQALVPGSDTVIHLAGPPSVAGSFEAPKEYASIHVVGTATLLSACKDGGIRRFVYVSSADVYGQPRNNPVREDQPLRALSPYAAAKIGAEQFVSAFASATGLEAIILRPFSIYGPGLSRRSLIATIVGQILKDGAVRLHDLSPVRDYCFVSDLADAVVRGCTGKITGMPIINVGSGIGTNVAEVARLILELMQIDAPVMEVEQRDRPRDSEINCLVADPSRARHMLGWEAKTDLHQGLKKTIGVMTQFASDPA